MSTYEYTVLRPNVSAKETEYCDFSAPLDAYAGKVIVFFAEPSVYYFKPKGCYIVSGPKGGVMGICSNMPSNWNNLGRSYNVDILTSGEGGNTALHPHVHHCSSNPIGKYNYTVELHVRLATRHEAQEALQAMDQDPKLHFTYESSDNRRAALGCVE